MRTSRAGMILGALGALMATVLPAAPKAGAAAAGTLHLPDLQSVIPLDQMSIAQDTTGRVFRYTHVIANFGDGPLEIKPSYDPATDTAVGVQNIYTHDSSGSWSIAQKRPIVGHFFYHAAHGHYHYPLAEFGLYQVAPDGSVGAPVVMSPKVGFCIADSAEFNASLPHVDEFHYSGGACTDPRSTLGISVGYGDIYDNRDAGQSIPADGLPDGTFWFRAVADPDNFLVEKDETNNITDVKVQVVGDTVTVIGGAQHPSSAPPTVTLTNPTGGAAAGTTTLQATASDASGIASVQFLLDGLPLGPPDTTAPYTLDWDSTTVPDGGHTLAARATNGKGVRGTTAATEILVNNNGGGITALSPDVVRFADGRGTVTTPAFDTAEPGELLVAFVSGDGQGGQTATVSGGGLTWSLVRRSNGQLGTSEMWTARASGMVTGAQITSTLTQSNFDQSLTVASFAGAGGIGATSIANAASGAPKTSLTTTADGSWVYGVGNDWDNAVARTPLANQELVHQFVDTAVGDTFWSQRTTAAVRGTAVPVTLGASAPTNDRYNMAAVEIVPGAPLPPGPLISDVAVLDRTSSSVRVVWTTDLPSTTQVEYGPTSSYGWSTPLNSTQVTSHSAPLSGLDPETTYHYRVVSTDGAGNTVRSPDFVFSTAAVSTMTCNLTAPADGSTVSGTVTVSADASSTASVSGVTFKVGSTTIGTEDTSPPYSVQWDTRTVGNGAQTLTAIARDPTGNAFTSLPITVNVLNTAPVVPAGRVASYGFEEGTGTTTVDRSGSGNLGTISGATWTTDGKRGRALVFNGTNSMVSVPDSPSLHLTGPLSIDAWVKPSRASSWASVVLKERPSGLSYALYGSDDGGRPAGYVNNGSDRAATSTGATAVGGWSHLAVTYDGSSLKLYVNGSLVRTTAVTGAVTSSNGALRIGGNNVWGEWFAGTIDEVNVYNRALSAAEVTQDMNA